jgi:hypothetical protein
MGTYSGLLCVCERAKPDGTPTWVRPSLKRNTRVVKQRADMRFLSRLQHSAAVAGAGAGLLTSLRPAIQSRRPGVALLTSVTMAAVTAGVERVRGALLGDEER